MNYKYLLCAAVTAAMFAVGCSDKAVGPSKPDGYTLTVEVNDQAFGSVSVDPKREFYRDGDIVRVTAKADSGYGFSRWEGASTSKDSVAIITITQNTTLKAIFGHTYAPLQFNTFPTNSGSVSVDPQKDIYVEDDTVKITVKANTGYVFGGWTGWNSADGVNSEDTIVTVTMNRDRGAITARFTKVHALAINIEPEDAGDVEFDPTYPQKPYYDEGDTVTVIATAKSGYQFIGWSVEPAVTTNTPLGDMMTVVIGKNDVVLTANFEPDDITP